MRLRLQVSVDVSGHNTTRLVPLTHLHPCGASGSHWSVTVFTGVYRRRVNIVDDLSVDRESPWN